MNKHTNKPAGFFALLIFIAVCYGAYVFFQDGYHYLLSLQHESIWMIVFVISVFYTGYSIRGAGYVYGIRRLKTEKKSECYCRFLQSYGRLLVQDNREAGTRAIQDELEKSYEDIALWASPNVIKQIIQLRNKYENNKQDIATLKEIVDLVIQAMRSDLGQNTLGFNNEELGKICYPAGFQEDIVQKKNQNI